MKNKVTKYQKNYNKEKTIFASLFLAIIFIVLLILFIYFYKDKAFSNNIYFKAMIIFIFSFLFLFILGTIISILLGKTRAKVKINKENKSIIKDNPYLYYRNLPNNFGIGVNSLLIDSNLENYKDIVAVILDLCAKKYIKLENIDKFYTITVIKNIDKDLLSNEKYILSLLIYDNIKNVDYQEWFNYCLQDAINLGLIKDINEDGKANSFKIGQFKDIFNNLYEFNYTLESKNNLNKTDKGIKEIQKLTSFKDFINDFGKFADKHIDEILLWDRYLSYAQLFGLTDKIMKTGYNQLINNSSFKIDSIDNINLTNIKIKK